MRLFLLLTLPLYILDQITKFLVLAYIPTHLTIGLIPGFFNLVQVHNTGAAFGMLKDNNAFFIGLASIALIAVALMAWRGCFHDSPTRIGAALLASGILGNLTDRILHGHVIDFLDVILPWYGHWPAFNVADSCICVAAFLFVISGFTGEKTANSSNSRE